MNELLVSRAVQALFSLAALALAGVVHADDRRFETTLSGAQEVVVDEDDNFVPGGTDSDATGTVTAEFDAAFTEVTVDLTVDQLTGAFSGAHFHCGRPGQNGPIAFGMVSPGPLEFDGGQIRGTLTNEDYTGEDCTEVIGRPINNIAALAFAMHDGLIYANVHTDMFPAGETRGQMLEVDDDGSEDDSDDDSGNGSDDDGDPYGQ